MKAEFSLIVKGRNFKAAVYFSDAKYLNKIELLKDEQHVQYIFQNACTGKYYMGDECQLLPGFFRDVCLVLDQHIRYLKPSG